MASTALPDEKSCLLINPKEHLWINLYPNALTNVQRALKTHLDQRIGKFCNKYVDPHYCPVYSFFLQSKKQILSEMFYHGVEMTTCFFRNNAILLSYTNLKFTAKHFQVGTISFFGRISVLSGPNVLLGSFRSPNSELMTFSHVTLTPNVSKGLRRLPDVSFPCLYRGHLLQT